MPITTRKTLALLAAVIAAAGLVLVTPTPASAAATTITLTGPTRPALTYDDLYFEGQLSEGSTLPRVVFQVQTADGWHDLSGWTPAPDGSFDMPYWATARGTYHFRVRSLGGSVLSNVVDLEVAPHPTEIWARVTGRGGPDVFVGQKLWVTGNVIEPTATPRVVVQRLVNGKWSDRAAGPVNAKGEFSVAIAPSQAGHYELRVRSNGGSKVSLYPISFDVQPKPIALPVS